MTAKEIYEEDIQHLPAEERLKLARLILDRTIPSDIQSMDTEAEREEWHRFIEETYGSCPDLTERPPQGPFETRDRIS